MGMDANFVQEVQTIVDAALDGSLTHEQAERSHVLGPEFKCAVLMAITAGCRTLAAGSASAAAPQASGPHTPSGAVPPYAKAPASRSRRKRPGAKPGHKGHRRPSPQALDRVVQVAELCACPECNGAVNAARRRRRRVVEDIPAPLGGAFEGGGVERDVSLQLHGGLEDGDEGCGHGVGAVLGDEGDDLIEGSGGGGRLFLAGHGVLLC
jgi:hypothetical protein